MVEMWEKPQWESSDLRLERKHWQLSRGEKRTFYRILKCLLTDPCSLKEGEWDEEKIPNAETTGRLVYGKKSCEVSVLDEKGNVLQSGVAATLDIYLRWREGEPNEFLSLVNLQRVQNELAVFGINSTRVSACFTLAKREFLKEPSYHKNCRLQIICEEVTLAFLYGSGRNEITILYDDQEKTPLCHLAPWKDAECTDFL